MSTAAPSPAERACAVVHGEQDAEQLIAHLHRGGASGDELAVAMLALVGLADRQRLAGFCRRLQKALEARGR